MNPTLRLTTALFSIAAATHLAPAQDRPPNAAGRPLPPPSKPGAALFTKLAPADCGVDFVNPIDLSHPLKRLYIGSFACGGVAIGDLDGDGLQDLLCTGGAVENALFLQDPASVGSLRFKRASGSGIEGGDRWAGGAALADVDGDGDLDIYIGNYDAPNQLLINESKRGVPKFVDAAEKLGVAVVDASLMPSFCDYDLDGDLDLFLLTSDYKRDGGRPKDLPIEYVEGAPQIKKGFENYYALIQLGPNNYMYINAGKANRLFRNDGERFTEVTESCGIKGRTFGNSATWWDYNLDGYPDLYLANDFKSADQLWVNNGDGTFTDMIVTAAPHTTWFSMGSDVADVDGDGRLDLLVADMANTTHYKAKVLMGEMSDNRDFLMTAVPRQYMRNTLFLNNGTGRLQEAAYLAGLASTDWTWSVKFGDYDNDGRSDVFFTNGTARTINDSDKRMPPDHMFGKTEWDFWEPTPPRPEDNLAFRNLGGLKFENTSKEWGVGDLAMSYAAATGDLDGDGDLEIVVANLEEPVAVYQNNSAAPNRLRLKLAARGKNTLGVGAVVRLSAGGREQIRQMQPATGFVSCNEPFLHFGLGDAAKVDWLEVRWPSGALSRFDNLDANQFYTLREIGESEAQPAPPTARPKPMFTWSKSLREIIHADEMFDDYKRQPLLPWSHSRLGPGIAFADVNADGLDDFFIGRAANNAGYIYLNKGGGKFVVETDKPFNLDKDCEDMAPLFLDADADGDLDLFIASGSSECEPGAAMLRDRLYLNDGKGEFTAAPTRALPQAREFSAAAAAADFDRDGDLDLFVGGRMVPGRWPETPSSRLLRNDGTPGEPKFTDVTAEVAPALAAPGMVTSAIWSDATGDGWIDLLVTLEFGPVLLFQNVEGKLEDRTAGARLADLKGWWNGIAARDIDNDGDIDYAVTGFGSNTTYHPSADHPEIVYYGDMDGTGKMNIIEAKIIGHDLFPRRGLSCSSDAMPMVREKMKTFHNFAKATLSEIYSDDRLKSAKKWEVTEIHTGALINDGSAHFTFVPLPYQAQLAPAFGIALQDFDADGITDCALTQGFNSPQPETGHMDGGFGMFLRGTGNPAHPFAPVEPTESRLIAIGDAGARHRGPRWRRLGTRSASA
ncbi:MAG: VCBS repeat-containing protein [Verrucomicrobiales bacterium]